jgi:hypothetical protein
MPTKKRAIIEFAVMSTLTIAFGVVSVAIVKDASTMAVILIGLALCSFIAGSSLVEQLRRVKLDRIQRKQQRACEDLKAIDKLDKWGKK